MYGYIKTFFVCLALLLHISVSAQWRKIYINSTSDLFGLHQTQGKAFACGNSSTVLKSNDSGKSWIKLNLSIPSNLRTVYFFDSLNGLVSGENARIQKTYDGGKTWSQKYIRTAAFIFDMTFNSNYGIGVGKDLLAISSIDAGETWQVDTTPLVRKQFNSVSISANGNCWAVGDSGFVFKKHQSEKKWNQVLLNTKINLTSVNTIGDSIVIISGGMPDTAQVGKHLNSLFMSIDSGKSWLSTTLPELKTIYSSYFFSGDTGFICGTNGIVSKVYQVFNQRSLQLTGTSSALNKIHFTKHNGLIVGDGGTILRTVNRGGFGLSLDALFNIRIVTYPNPFKKTFKIDSSIDIVNTQIISTNGQPIQHIFLNDEVTLENVAEGVYYLLVELSNGSSYQTIIQVAH